MRPYLCHPSRHRMPWIALMWSSWTLVITHPVAGLVKVTRPGHRSRCPLHFWRRRADADLTFSTPWFTPPGKHIGQFPYFALRCQRNRGPHALTTESLCRPLADNAVVGRSRQPHGGAEATAADEAVGLSTLGRVLRAPASTRPGLNLARRLRPRRPTLRAVRRSPPSHLSSGLPPPCQSGPEAERSVPSLQQGCRPRA